jgi:hypothetical protein
MEQFAVLLVTAFQRLTVTVSSGYMKFGTRVTECDCVIALKTIKLDRLVAVQSTFIFVLLSHLTTCQ